MTPVKVVGTKGASDEDGAGLPDDLGFGVAEGCKFASC
jgi:hypothetical protein